MNLKQIVQAAQKAIVARQDIKVFISGSINALFIIAFALDDPGKEMGDRKVRPTDHDRCGERDGKIPLYIFGDPCFMLTKYRHFKIGSVNRNDFPSSNQKTEQLTAFKRRSLYPDHTLEF